MVGGLGIGRGLFGQADASAQVAEVIAAADRDQDGLLDPFEWARLMLSGTQPPDHGPTRATPLIS